MNWAEVLSRLISGVRLTSLESSALMREVLEGKATSAQLAALLVLLRTRGETVDEIVGFSSALLEASTPLVVDASLRERLVDTCGTGGDRSGTINVSTMAALVVAAADIPVCKHGNRAQSSQTGSADVLDALGVASDIGPEGVVACIEQANIGFCFAPRFHPALKHVGPTRRELGVGTVFNFLGPLINPARVTRQVIGISDPRAAELMIGVLRENGATRAMVVHGHDGLDELTTTTTSSVWELRDGEITSYEIDPTSYGFALTDPALLKGGGHEENASRVQSILGGEVSAQSDIVALNSAAALVVGGSVDNIADGVELARTLLSGGKAMEVLERMANVSQSFRD